MPELPEVETVKRALAPVMESRAVARVVVRRPDLRKPFPKTFANRLQGTTVTHVGRRGKYLVIETTGETLIWHLGMSGRVRIYAPGDDVPPPGPHDHVQFEMGPGSEGQGAVDQGALYHGPGKGAVIVFTDPRRFGLMDLCPAGGWAAHPLLRSIGPEPLGNDFSGPVLARALKGRAVAIKQALLDGRVVAGVGNIYASEALFRAGLSPKRKAGTVQGGRAERLAGAIKAVLSEAIEAGGSTLRDHRQADGSLGYFQYAFAVYDRAGQACPGCDCDISKTGGIQRLEQGGRSTYYCPRKQR